jgi:hypothetical protein
MKANVAAATQGTQTQTQSLSTKNVPIDREAQTCSVRIKVTLKSKGALKIEPLLQTRREQSQKPDGVVVKEGLKDLDAVVSCLVKNGIVSMYVLMVDLRTASAETNV